LGAPATAAQLLRHEAAQRQVAERPVGVVGGEPAALDAQYPRRRFGELRERDRVAVVVAAGEVVARKTGEAVDRRRRVAREERLDPVPPRFEPAGGAPSPLVPA
jgi:hypothetical protein